MKTIEIELRYHITDTAQLTSFLEPMRLMGSKYEVDEYLDTSDLKLYQRGIYIRLRNNKFNTIPK